MAHAFTCTENFESSYGFKLLSPVHSFQPAGPSPAFQHPDRAGLVKTNSLSLFWGARGGWVSNVLISPSLWRTVLPVKGVDSMADRFFASSTLNILAHCLLASRVSEWGFLVCDKSFSLAAFNILSLSLDSLIIRCLGVGLFEFIMLGIHWASWMFVFMSFKFGRFRIIISSNNISAPFSLSSRIPTMFILTHLMVSHRSVRLCSVFFFLFFRNDIFYCPIFKFTNQICLVKFSIESL